MKKLIKKRPQLPALTTIAFLFIFGLMLTAASIYLLPTRFTGSIRVFAQSPMLIVLNTLPIWLLMGFLYGLSRNLIVAVIPPTVITFAISLINRSKVFFRDEPFLPADIFLINEVRYVVSGETFHTEWNILALILLFALIIIGLIFVQPYKPKWKISLPSAVACVVAMAILMPTVYWNQGLYGRFPVKGSSYRLVDIHNSRGSVYSFISFLSRFSPQRPPGFSEQLAREILSKQEISQYPRDPGRINIIVVMSESFTRLSDNPAFSFDCDPLRGFHEVAARGVSGDIIVPNFGGGTANTEFDVLTGFATQFIRESPSSFWFIRQPFESVVSVLINRGYYTVAMHPGTPWFYNRQNVYRHLGFHDMYFREDFMDAGAELITGLVNEASTFDFLYDVINNHDMTGGPLFAYLVTIQNHMPFRNRFHSYPEGMTSGIPFDEAGMNELSNYFYGIRQSSEELLRLANFLDAQYEPYLLVFYSDHLPPFAGGIDMYRLLGKDFAAQPELQFKVPFLIFANEAAQGDVNLENVPTLFSAKYMGQQILDILGYERDTAWFSFLTNHIANYPVMDVQAEAAEFRILQYYFLGHRLR